MFQIRKPVSIYSAMRPLQSGDLLDALDAKAKRKLLGLAPTVYIPAGRAIFEVDSAGPRVWILSSGRALLSFRSQSSRKPRSRPARPGEVLGLTETLAGVPYDSSAKTLSECSFHIIDHDELTRLLSDDPVFRRALLGKLSRNYLDAYKKVVRCPSR